MTSLAAKLLCASGLFRLDHDDGSLNIFTDYKKDSIRLRTEQSNTLPQNFLLFSDKSWSLEPLDANSVCALKSGVASPQILDSLDDDLGLSGLRFPRLPALFRGLAHRYIEFDDDMAMIASEQLVDGMDLDQEWIERHLSSAGGEIFRLAERLVRRKSSRLDEFNGNAVTCFIATRDEAERLREIVGYD
jgi:hypothetical protein